MVVLKRYWAEIITFAAITTIILIDLAPDMTWMNTDSDGVHYVYAAKYLYLAHNTSSPLFLLLGRLFLFLPFGTETWRMTLILGLSTIIASVMIYKIILHKLNYSPQAKWYGLISSLIYGGSALVISQSTIVDTYALVTLFAIIAYYFAIKGHWFRSALFVALLWGTHTLFAWVAWIPLLVQYKPMRDRVLVGIALLGFLFYLYIPLVVIFNNPPPMWGNDTFAGFFAGQGGLLLMLTGGLAIYDMPQRILDTIGIVGVSLGLALLVCVYYLWKHWKSEKALLSFTLIPIVYFATNLSKETYVYMMPTIAFGAIAAGLGLSKLDRKWMSYAVALCAVLLMLFNVNYFDIGRTLDPEMSARKFWGELDKIPDDDIFMGGGWNWAMVYAYNKEEGRNIIAVSTDTFPSKKYRQVLDGMGIIYVEPSTNDSMVAIQAKMMLSIAENNAGVWIAKETKPEVFQYVIEPARGNEEYLARWIDSDIEPKWRWTPSNPYKFIDGSLEVAEWNRVLLTSHNANVAIAFALFALSGYWLVLRWWDKRIGKSVRNVVVEKAKA